jgi:L-asparaginase
MHPVLRKAPRPVVLLTTGGTIAMTPGAGGRVAPALDAGALAAAVPGLAVDDARTVRTLPGVHLGLADALAVAHAAAAEAAAGRGVVVTTGTDTLEELAALAHVVRTGDGAVVLTGAIRPAQAPGADGPANVLDAAAVARVAPAGTYVVFAGEVHAAREARKVDATSPRAFGSPRTGPLGHVAEGRVALAAAPPPGPGLAVAAEAFARLSVPVVPTHLGDDGSLLRAAAALGPDGVVLVALGAGQVPPAVLAALGAVRAPVAACVRPERGTLLRATYGFPRRRGRPARRGGPRRGAAGPRRGPDAAARRARRGARPHRARRAARAVIAPPLLRATSMAQQHGSSPSTTGG